MSGLGADTEARAAARSQRNRRICRTASTRCSRAPTPSPARTCSRSPATSTSARPRPAGAQDESLGALTPGAGTLIPGPPCRPVLGWKWGSGVPGAMRVVVPAFVMCSHVWPGGGSSGTSGSGDLCAAGSGAMMSARSRAHIAAHSGVTNGCVPKGAARRECLATRLFWCPAWPPAW